MLYFIKISINFFFLHEVVCSLAKGRALLLTLEKFTLLTFLLLRLFSSKLHPKKYLLSMGLAES
jgi:hypothetical protein